MNPRIDTADDLYAFSINETCRRLGISRSLAYELLRDGKLNSVRVGSRQRIPSDELRRYLDSCRAAA